MIHGLGLAANAQKKKAAVVPGTLFRTTSGNFVVPAFNTLVVEMWGAGGAGISRSINETGPTGGNTTFQGMIAGGGIGAVTTTDSRSPGSGGSFSGGDTGSVGTNGDAISDNSGPFPPFTANQQAPNNYGQGGPGMSGETWGPEGGSGAYVKKTYAKGTLTVGASLAVVIGTGAGSIYGGGLGMNGLIKFAWT